MKLVTREDMLAVVERRWYEQYYDRNLNKWKEIRTGDSKGIYDRLVALNPRTHQAAAEIIGNESWTQLYCNCCHNYVDAVVYIDVTDGEYTTGICSECIGQMANMVKDLHWPQTITGVVNPVKQIE